MHQLFSVEMQNVNLLLKNILSYLWKLDQFYIYTQSNNKLIYS